jgi:hypothetical protein
MDTSSTYFEVLPKELWYLILSSLDMKDICDMFGYDFYEKDKYLFNMIIKRDFSTDILVNLIDTTSLDVMLRFVGQYKQTWYDRFLYKFRSILIEISNLKVGGESLKLKFKPGLSISDFEKLGVRLVIDGYSRESANLEGMVFNGYVFCVLKFPPDNLCLYFTPRGIGSIPNLRSTNMTSMANLLFFFHIDTIFTIL